MIFPFLITSCNDNTVISVYTSVSGCPSLLEFAPIDLAIRFIADTYSVWFKPNGEVYWGEFEPSRVTTRWYSCANSDIDDNTATINIRSGRIVFITFRFKSVKYTKKSGKSIRTSLTFLFRLLVYCHCKHCHHDRNHTHKLDKDVE